MTGALRLMPGRRLPIQRTVAKTAAHTLNQA